MKVMVTGASTPLGLAIVEKLLATPEISFVLAVAKERRPAHLEDGPRLRYRSADLTRLRNVHDLAWGDAHHHQIDTVIHTALHRRASDAGRTVHAQNVEATRALVLACMDHPTIHRFVYRSFADVYSLKNTTTNLLEEDDPLDFDPDSPQWVRDRVEADLTVCAHFGGPLTIAVLRCAELLAPDSGSQLWDYLSSRVCLRPLGFDPMLDVLSLDDAAAAFVAAARHSQSGVFNIPGADRLPLSHAIAESLRLDIAVPGPMMSPLYRLRRMVAGFDFRYDLNVRRFHLGGILDGRRAREGFGYVPRVPATWPRPWWRRLIDQLAADRAIVSRPDVQTKSLH
jgi:UDP-glucose 4-epimerase